MRFVVLSVLSLTQAAAVSPGQAAAALDTAKPVAAGKARPPPW